VVAVAAAVAAVVEDAGRTNRERVSEGENKMKQRTSVVIASRTRLTLLVLGIFSTFGLQSQAAPQAKGTTSAAAQRSFDSADNAAKALVDAAEKYDVPALLAILGPGAEDLVSSDDPVSDKERAQSFARSAREKQSVTMHANRTRAELTVGEDEWPLPVPIINQKGKWIFDTRAGRQEILYRRIGENELNAIQICRGLVEAEQDYAETKHDGSQLNQYAQRIISTPGKHDGLAWQNADGSWGGPVGEEVAKALQRGYVAGNPYHGYYFKVLNGQGPAAPLGTLDYAIEGAMIGGFAMVATPAQYRVSGVKTFMVSHDGIVYEKDLGLAGLDTFKQMERYNPDKSWQRTDDGE
jgi:hypothetical protein